MPDNLESRMNFITEQQAQFAVGMRLLKKRQTCALRTIGKLLQVTTSLARRCGKTNRSRQETDRRRRAFGKETDRILRERARLGAKTERRLETLIQTVDKLARRNGP